MKLELNPQPTITWLEVGDHGTQVLLVDDCLTNAEEVKAFASSLAYNVPSLGEPVEYYPGLRAFATLEGATAIVRWVAERMLDRLYPSGWPSFLTVDNLNSGCVFTVVACDEASPPPNISDQHTDGAEWLATILHLSEVTEGRGTALWEHRPTGLQHWVQADPVQVQLFERYLGLRMSSQLARAIDRAPVYCNGDVEDVLRAAPGRRLHSPEEDENWRLLTLIPSRFNRLAVYPTWQLHSIVDTSHHHGPLTPRNMRLTMNQFVRYPFPSEALPYKTAYPTSFYRPVKGLPR